LSLESALLVPVPAAEPLVHTHRLAYDPVAAAGIPAHVTILYPFVPPGELTSGVEEEVRRALDGFPAFDFTLTRVQRFDDGVLYLAPEPAGPFTALTTTITRRWPEHPPYGGAFDPVIPHLTVAMSDGASVEALVPELAAGLPIATRAEEVCLMVGREEGIWEVRDRFPLA
jgi:2'-5' RNA ligase